MRTRTGPTGEGAGGEGVRDAARGPHPLRIRVLTWGFGGPLVAAIVAAALSVDDAERQAPAPTPARSLAAGIGGFGLWLTFSPDGRRLASLATDESSRIWGLEGAEERREFAIRNPRQAAFSRDGATLAIADRTPAIRLLDVESGRTRTELKSGDSTVWSLAASQDGAALASGHSDGTIRLWDWHSPRERIALRGGTAPITALAFSHDGRTLAAAEGDGVIRLWDLAAAAARAATPAHRTRVIGLAFAPGDATLASATMCDPVVNLWDPATGRHRAALLGEPSAVIAIAYSPDGSTLAVAGRWGTISLWDPASSRLRATFRAHAGCTLALAYSPDGSILASSGDDEAVKLWRVEEISSEQSGARRGTTRPGIALARGRTSATPVRERRMADGRPPSGARARPVTPPRREPWRRAPSRPRAARGRSSAGRRRAGS